jgi:cobalt-zinc-cadmium efflux system outer membrane protein
MPRHLLILLACVLLFGCAVKPEPRFEELKKISDPRVSGELVWSRTPEDEATIDRRVTELLDGGVTRQEAVQIALLNNRALQISLDQLGVAEADFVQAGLYTNPSFAAFLGFPLANGQSDFGLSVFLSDLWQVPARKKMASSQVEATIREVGTVVVSTATDAAMAFDAVLLHKVLLLLAQDDVQLAEAYETRKAIRYRHGLTIQPSIEIARAQLSKTRVSLAESEEALISSLTELDVILSLRGDRSTFEVVGDLSVLPRTDWTPEAAVSFALKNRHDIARDESQVQAAERAIAYQKTLVFRSVGAGGGYVGTISPGTQNNSGGPTLGLEVPIFDQNQAQIAKADYRLAQQKKTLEESRIAAQAEIFDALALYEAANIGILELKDTILPELNRAIAFSEQWSHARQLVLLEQLMLEQSRISAKRQLAWEEKRMRRADIRLHQALWGGSTH